jgi:cytoskeletal protein CcmA (bactofilin family)
VYVRGSRAGQVDSSGRVYVSGSRVGEIEADGDVYVRGSRAGQIESDGDVYVRGSRWGSATQCCGGAASLRRLGAVLFFFEGGAFH